jgi:hypothetical protein
MSPAIKFMTKEEIEPVKKELFSRGFVLGHMTLCFYTPEGKVALAILDEKDTEEFKNFCASSRDEIDQRTYEALMKRENLLKLLNGC